MVRTLVGDLFASEAQTLVNTVNCVGVMGKGIALEFRKRFPAMYEDYAGRCRRHEVHLGEPYLFRGLMPPWIINFPTKDHWRSVSRLSDIVAGLEYLKAHYREWGVYSLAVPPLGCGQGQLEWRVVGPTLWRYLRALDIPVELYAPAGTPASQLDDAFLAGDAVHQSDGYGLDTNTSAVKPKIDPAWVALVEILARIDREPYHWPVGRVTFQKIAYFATECDIPTGLQYAKGSYGPFAHDLKGVTTRLVNNGLIHEEQSGRMFIVRPGPTYPDAAQAFKADLNAWEEPIARITDLFMRMQTQQAEVAATVHYAAHLVAQQTHTRPTERQVFDAVMEWKQRRQPPLDQDDVAQAVRHLNVLRWLDVQPSSDLPLGANAAEFA
jgi:O-acetyl-ADP-ribose deacetylase (regulator of RNase III)/uncharacterized protein YwgA